MRCAPRQQRGSLLLALLFHSSVAVTGVFLASADAPLIETVLTWAAAGVVIADFGAKRLSRRMDKE